MTAFEMQHFDFSDETLHRAAIARTDGSLRRARYELVVRAMPEAIRKAEDVDDLKIVVRELFSLITQGA